MYVYFATTKRLTRIGGSLSFIVPSNITRLLHITGNTVFYVYVEKDRIVYALNPPGVKARKIKPRAQARFSSNTYYVLTVPKEYSIILGLSEGSLVVLKCYDRMLVLEPVKGAH